MRIFLWVLSLFAAAVGLAITVHFNAGNVVFFWPPYRIDLSLNFFILLLILLYILVFLIVIGIRLAWTMPSKIAISREMKKERDSNDALRESLRALLEGRFVQSANAANKAWVWDKNKSYSALIAARASHALQQFEKRDEFLKSVEGDKNCTIASQVTKAELLIDEYRPDQALDVIKKLNANGTRHIHIQRLALKANQQINNWQEVLRLVQSLDNHHAIKPLLSEKVRELAYEKLFSAINLDIESVEKIWQKISLKDRKIPSIAISAAQAFGQYGFSEKGRAILIRALNKDWSDSLINAFVNLSAEEGSQDLLKQIELCEGWVTQYPERPMLLWAMGELCYKQKLWKKAELFFEKSINLKADSQLLSRVHLKLAQLHEILNQSEKAAYHYRESSLAGLK